MKNITLTEKQEWFIKCAIEAQDAVLPLNALDDELFEKDYFFTKSEIKEEINNLKLNIEKVITTLGHTVYPEMSKSEYYLRCSWDATCQERDELKNQIKVLSAIKKGLESSLKECLSNISDNEWITFNDNPQNIGIYLVTVKNSNGKIITGRSYWNGEAWDIVNLMHNANEPNDNDGNVIQWRKNN